MKDLSRYQPNNYCALSQEVEGVYCDYDMGEKSYAKQNQGMLVEKTLKLSTEMLSSATKDELKLSDISEPHENDVLMGRGGKNNQHVGNENLRVVARERCMAYQAASKKGKSMISRELVKVVRDMSPPGRFLRKDPSTLRWEDVGNAVAREKTSQVLRDAVAFFQASPSSSVASKETSSVPDSTSAGGTRRRREDVDYDQREYTVCARHQASQRELRSGNHPYLQMPQPSEGSNLSADSVSNTPIDHLPVTPASVTDARKRPRYYESLLPISYPNTPNQTHFSTPTHPLGMMLSPPSKIARPHHQDHYHHHPYHYPFHRPYYPHGTATGSFMAPNSPFGNSNYYRNYVVPSSSGTSITTTTTGTSSNATDHTNAMDDHTSVLDVSPAQGDFDLFNGELLSDNSTGRDGAYSPFAYPDL